MRNYSYLLGDNALKKCMIVDPCWDPEGLIAKAKEDNFTVCGAICTHYHWDHVGGCLSEDLLKRLGIPLQVIPQAKYLPGLKEVVKCIDSEEEMVVYAHENEYKKIAEQTEVDLKRFFVTKDGTEFSIGDQKIKVIHTPGFFLFLFFFLS